MIRKTKKVVFAAMAVLAFASCSEDTYIGEQSSQNTLNNNGSGAIAFNSASKSITRATGAEAAALLNNNFVVEGIKTVTVNETTTKSEVFDNYNVNYTANTAATTASNSANWEYVGQSVLSGKTGVAEQSIKYWDFAAKKYDFWAYSLGVSTGGATVSSLDHDAELGTSAYTIQGTKAQLSTVYISDLVTAYNPNKTVSGVANDKTAPAEMGNEVDLTFRSLMSKVRVGLYETIPGYSVREVKFYPSAAGSATTTAALYAASAVLPAFDASTNDATYTVTFPTTGAGNIGDPDYNKAHVAISSNDKASKVEFGTLTYGAHQTGKHEKTGFTAAHDAVPDSWTDIWVQRTANTCTWATEGGASAGDYSIVLPYETGAVLTLKLDYTLESIDGTGETIVVHGATALVPAQYTQWKANYAYTYIFKISDNTNGLTNTVNADKVGLYPISLDAIVVGNEEGSQETITTVDIPSITTYSITSDVVRNDEYTTSDDIYVIATANGTLMSMTGKATLYDITKSSAAYLASEAEVLAALTTYTSLSGGTYTGRNSVVLTPVSDALDLTVETIPTVDGQTVSITAGEAALIDNSKLDAGHNYAYVYETTPGSTTTDKYEAITATVGTTVVTSYYTRSGEGTVGDPYVYTPVVAGTNSDGEGKAISDVTYYDKYTEVRGATYAIKVIKIKSA